MFKKVLRFSIKWLLKKMTSIVIFIIIIAVAILIDVYGTDIPVNSVNVLLAVAAVFSTFFLYLAFNESRISNALKRSELIIDQIDKDINAFDIKSKESIFYTILCNPIQILKYPSCRVMWYLRL
jgi:hypothetical protein